MSNWKEIRSKAMIPYTVPIYAPNVCANIIERGRRIIIMKWPPIKLLWKDLDRIFSTKI